MQSESRLECLCWIGSCPGAAEAARTAKTVEERRGAADGSRNCTPGLAKLVEVRPNRRKPYPEGVFLSDIWCLHAHQAEHQIDLTTVVDFVLLHAMDKPPLSWSLGW